MDTDAGSDYVSLKKALCHKKHRYTTLIGLMLAVDSQISGVNLIVSYVYTLFE